MEWDDVSRLVQLFKEQGLGELEFEDERFRLKLKTPQTVAAPMASVVAAPAAAAGPRPEAPSAPVDTGRVITSPFVGTFYRQPSPDSSPYVEVGQIVSKGQVLCIVEAMKLMNEIEAETNGRIVQIYVENGRPVEFGEKLFLIEPL